VLLHSGANLQHSQSASPADVRVYNENLGLSDIHAAKVPDHLPMKHARHQHVTQVPEPPPVLHEGAMPSRSRAAAVENGSGASHERVTEQRLAGGGSSMHDVEHDYRLPASPNVSSTHFTSDISLASSSVTTYEDNGRQKVCLFFHPFHIVTFTTSDEITVSLPSFAFCSSVCLCVCLLACSSKIYEQIFLKLWGNVKNMDQMT